MKRNQNLIRLGPRIKLFRRHMQELKALLVQQSQVRLLTQTHQEQPIKTYPDNQLSIILQITNQVIRLTELMERQSVERGQMKDRHRLEELLLEQAIDTH